MAAYAALTSLMHIIDDIEHHPSPPIIIDKQQVESLTQTVTFLHEFLEHYNSPFAYSNEADPLEMRIAEAAYAAEDAIESHIVDIITLRRSSKAYHLQIYSEGETSTSSGSNNQRKPMMWSNYFGCLMKPGRKIKSIDHLYRGLQKVIKDMDLIKKEVMEMTAEKTSIEAQLQRNVSTSIGSSRSSNMVGFDDVFLEILDKLTYGQYDLQVIPIVGMGGIGKTTLAKHVYAQPLIKQHFDICAWATISQNFDTREILCELLSQANKRSKEELSNMCEDELGLALHKYLFNRRFLIVMDDMWSIEAWEKIQGFFPDNSNGSRIVVTTRLSKLSSQLNMICCIQMKFLDEVSSWDLFSKSVFGEEICPLELEECGKNIVENCKELPLSIVVVGGFLRPISGKNLETTAKEYLCDLVERNLIIVHELGSIGNIKYCRIHDLLRDLCWREAEKEGFYNVIGQFKFQGLKGQHRVVIAASIPKSEVPDALQSMPLARCVVCHNKEIQPLPKSRLLRTLKAYDRDGYGSHDYLLDDLLRFVDSWYLAVGVDREFKFSYTLNLLWNLQTLIIFHSAWVGAPHQIWEMSQLRHVEFHKVNLYLPIPPEGEIVALENLHTLKGVFLGKSDEAPLSLKIPNIKKLGVTCGALPNLDCLTKLESCRYWEIQDVKDSAFPYSLKKLSLGSNFSHWEVKEGLLAKIGALPLLQKLKLERAQFKRCEVGTTEVELKQWKTSEDQFPSLKFLELKWCILESWITESSHFPRLERLHLYGSKELEEIPSEIGEIPTLQSIHLEYCSESVVESAKAIAEEQEELQVGVVLLKTNQNLALGSLASRNFLVEFADL